MMFVIKGVVNCATDKVGELAIVSYQDNCGKHNLSFFFDKETIYVDFVMDYAEVISKLDRHPKEIISYSVKTFMRATSTSFDLVDYNVYTKEDREYREPCRSEVAHSVYYKQNAQHHQFYLPNLSNAVRSKSHIRQYNMKGINLAMKLAWENPIKHDEIDLYPTDSVYEDCVAMTDIVYLDYTIVDITSPSILDLTEQIKNAGIVEERNNYLEDDELRAIIEEYEENEELEPLEEEEDIEIDLPIKVYKMKQEEIEEVEEITEEIKVEEPLPRKTTKKTTIPRTSDGKFAPKTTNSKKKTTK